MCIRDSVRVPAAKSRDAGSNAILCDDWNRDDAQGLFRLELIQIGQQRPAGVVDAARMVQEDRTGRRQRDLAPAAVEKHDT